MENKFNLSTILLPKEEILWRQEITPIKTAPAKKKTTEKHYLLASPWPWVLMGGAASTAFVYSLITYNYFSGSLLLAIPTCFIAYLLFSKSENEEEPSTKEENGSSNRTSLYLITNKRVLEVEEEEVLALAYEDIYDMGFHLRDETSNTLIFSSEHAISTTETIDYGQLTYDFTKGPFSIQRTGVEVIFQNIPSALKVLNIAWKEWESKGPFAQVNNTMKELAKDYNLQYAPYNLDEVEDIASLEGEIDGLEFYLELRGRHPIKTFFIEILCPNPDGDLLLLKPAEGAPIDFEDAPTPSFNELFKVESDSEDFPKAILSETNKEILIDTQLLYPGSYEFKGEKQSKKIKILQGKKQFEDDTVLDLDMMTLEQKKEIPSEDTVVQGTWLLYHCDFMNIQRDETVPMGTLIKSAFQSTLALARSIDAYTE